MSPQGTHGVIPADLPEYSIFYREHFPLVTRYVMRSGATQEEAKDAAQVAMTALLFVWTSCGNPAGYVRKVAVRAYYKDAERSRKRTLLESRNARLAIVETKTPVEPDEHTQVMKLLRKLPLRQSQVLALHYEGYSTREIAELMRVEQGTVRSTLRHARNTLRSLLENSLDPTGLEIPHEED